MPAYSHRGNIAYILALLLLALLLLPVAIYNGYPLATSDTGSYINHAFDFQIPADRSPFYGVFVGLSSLWKSLWLTVIIQALIVAGILIAYANMLAAGKLPSGLHLLIGIAILLFTYTAWAVAHIMPDVFSGVLLLAVLLYLHQPVQSNIPGKLSLLLVLLLALSVHNSHYLILLLCSCILVILSTAAVFRKYMRKSLWLLGISVGWILFICTLNMAKGFGFTLSAGSHVFMMGKLSETGILKDYLEKNCNKHPYRLCAYSQVLPHAPWDFLWQPESPLYKTGGWDSSKVEYNAMIKDIFTQPRYIIDFSKKAVISTGIQLTQIKFSEDVLPAGSSPWLSLKKYIPKELQSFTHSVQNTGGLSTGTINYLQLAMLLLSSLWVLVCLPVMPQRTMLLHTYLFIALFLICNAFVTATFANVLARLQSRVFWVLPVTNIIVIVAYYYNKYLIRTNGKLFSK